MMSPANFAGGVDFSAAAMLVPDLSFLGDGLGAVGGLIGDGAGEVVQACGGCCGGIFEPVGEFFAGIGCGWVGEIGQFFSCVFGAVFEWIGGCVGGGLCDWVGGALDGGFCEFFGACFGPLIELLGNIDFSCFCACFAAVGELLASLDLGGIFDCLCEIIGAVLNR